MHPARTRVPPVCRDPTAVPEVFPPWGRTLCSPAVHLRARSLCPASGGVMGPAGGQRGQGGLGFGVAVSGDVPEPWGCGTELEEAAGRGGRGGSPAPWMGTALGSLGTAPPVPVPPPALVLGVLGAKRGVGSSPMYVRVPWPAPFTPQKPHGLTPEEGVRARHGAGPPCSTGRAQAGERQAWASHEVLHRPVQGATAGTRPPRGPAPGAEALVTASPGPVPGGEPGQPVVGATWQ